MEIGVKPIEGISTSTAGFLGRTEYGSEKPTLVTSFRQYQQRYGGYLQDSYLTYAVEGFFKNGGKRCFIGKFGKESKRSLASLKEIDEISILYIPDLHTRTDKDFLIRDIKSQCEGLGDRFAILDAPPEFSDVSNLWPPNEAISKYVAYYYPWIKIYDPLRKGIKMIPPGGHIAGIYARTDMNRGVHKAPANEVIHDALDVEFKITKAQQDILNLRGINCIRKFSDRGILVWGARTTANDPLWKYINVRRLLIYLEESIEEGTRWVVSEPNDERLWGKVKQIITQFLTRVWKDGALIGSTPEEAFFVKCDRTTMIQDDIDNGIMVVVVGVAPIKPAEFVTFSIAQWRSGSKVTE